MAEENGRANDDSNDAGESHRLPVSLPIERVYPNGLTNLYANHFTIQRAEHEFFLSFFAAVPPDIVAECQEEAQERLKEHKSVKAVCVARIVVPKDLMPEVFRAIKRVADSSTEREKDDSSEVTKGK